MASHGLGKRTAPDWSYLPTELLEAIARNISAMGDYFRYRAVCTSWRSASPPLPQHLPPQMPWLMVPYLPAPDGRDTERLFFDALDGKVHRLDLPETLGKCCAGSSRGWLVLVRDQEISLLNPITRSEVSLPPVSACLHALLFQAGPGVDNEENPIEGVTRPFSDGCFERGIVKAIVSSDPSTSDCTVMAILGTQMATGLAFCRVGDGSWTTIRHPGRHFRHVADITYRDGSFYAVADDGRLAVYKVGPPWSAQLIPSVPIGGAKCLAERPDGELFMVCRTLAGRRPIMDVFKLDVHGWEPGWVKVEDIGESMLFLGCWNHRHCITSEFSGRGGNCIYFVDRFHGYGNSQIGLLDIKEGRVEQIAADGLGTFSHDSKLPPWIWFQPNL